MGQKAPLVVTLDEDVPAVATGSTDSKVLLVVPFAGTVTSVTYIPKSGITGQNTNTRKVTVYNRKGDATGTTVVAETQYNSGTNAAADKENAVALSGTAANLEVAAGDVLEWVSAAVGSGLADPGGLVKVSISRTP